MHLAAQHEHQLHRRGAGQKQPFSARSAQVHDDAEGKGEHHQRHAQLSVGDGAQHGLIVGRPVAAQQEHQVAGGERRIGVAGERLYIFIHDPQRRGLIRRERQHDDRRHEDAAQQAQSDGLSRFLLLDRIAQQRRHAQRYQQSRLRLGQHGQREHGNRRLPLAPARQQQQRDQQHGEHRVDLSPARVRDDVRRIQRHQRRHAQRGSSAHDAVRRQEHGQRQQDVAEDGHGLEQHLAAHRAKGEAKEVRKAAQRAQHQHVRRRVVAEVALLIEVRRADGGHPRGPRAEAAHVHAVACHAGGQRHAQKQRRQQQPRQRRISPASVHPPAGEQRACKHKRRDQVRRRDGQQAGDHRTLAAVRQRRFLLRLGRGQVEYECAHRRLLHLLQAHVGEQRAARRLGAVAAQAHADRRLLLPRARVRVERQRLPRAVRVVHVLARAVDAQEGHVRAQLLGVAALRHHARGQPVGGVPAYGHSLLKARVVRRDVFHQRRRRSVRRRRRLQIRRAGAGHPHARVPVIGHAVGHGGKVPVLQQVARLDRLLPLLLRQKHHGARRQHKGQRRRHDAPFRFFLHF